MAICQNCEIEFTPKRNTHGIYCCQKCQIIYQNSTRIDEWLNNGVFPGKATIKAWLLIEQDNQCSHCGITEWNNKSIVFDLEHKDGNSENNVRDNLELICPNCHSQTSTYKGKNAGNGRYSRRKRYADGKSF